MGIQTMPLQVDDSQIFSNSDVMSSFWKNVEGNLVDKSPSFFSPWTRNSRIVPTLPTKTSPMLSDQEHEGKAFTQRKYNDISLLDISTIRKNSSLISPQVSLEASPASEGNATDSNSTEEILMRQDNIMGKQRNEDTKFERQCDNRFFINEPIDGGYLDENL